MKRGIAIYIEGGGDDCKTRDPFRRGMSAFLKPLVDLARKKRIQWRVIACGGRRETYGDFIDALKNEPEWHNMLLVDSEDAGADMNSPWTHLRNRKGDGWKRPAGVSDERCQLMVICMEAWFLADPDGLAGHFGSRFDKSQLPPADRAESMDKDAISRALSKAVQNTPAREYKKIRDGVKLLEKIDPEVVRRRCKWCGRLFNTLEELIDATS